MPITAAALRSLPVGSTISGPSIPTITVVSTAGAASTIQFILSTNADYNKFADALDSDEVTVQFPPTTTDPTEPPQAVNDLLSPHIMEIERIREAQDRNRRPAPPLDDYFGTADIFNRTLRGVSTPPAPPLDDDFGGTTDAIPPTTPPQAVQASAGVPSTHTVWSGIRGSEGVTHCEFSLLPAFRHAEEITQRDCDALGVHLGWEVSGYGSCHCFLREGLVCVKVPVPEEMWGKDCTTYIQPFTDTARGFLAGVAYAKSLTR